MKKYILLSIVLLASLTVFAHGSKSSSFFLAESLPGVWNIQVGASSAAFQYEYIALNDKKSLDNLDPEDFKQWIIDHLKNTIIIKVNGEIISLGNGFVKLGHQTSAKILAENMPNTVESISVQNLGFSKGLKNHKSHFKVIRSGDYSEKFILNTDNKYSINLEYNWGKLKIKGTSTNRNYFYSFLIFGFLTLIVVTLFYVIKRNNR